MPSQTAYFLHKFSTIFNEICYTKEIVTFLIRENNCVTVITTKKLKCIINCYFYYSYKENDIYKKKKNAWIKINDSSQWKLILKRDWFLLEITTS